MRFVNPKDEVIFDYLKKAKRVAVVGLSNKEERISYMVARVMQEAGYEIVPVNPVLEGQEVLGQKVYASIKDVPGHIDIVDIFRREEFLPELAEEFLTTDADVFWVQKGIFSDEAADILQKAGRDKIVMDRCTKIELARMN